LVPAEWVQESTTPQNSSAYYESSDQVEDIEWYGYHWWTWKPEWFHGHHAFNAKGYGGQEVLVLPELDLIIVTTATNENIPPDTAGDQEAEIYALFYDVLLPALEEIEP
jgi:CubicO group peptidase (beta-lactamase class C family)